MKILTKLVLSCAVFAALFAGSGQVKADTLAGDFSLTSNPSVNWTFGQYTSGLNPATFQAFTQNYTTPVDGNTLDIWNNPTSPTHVDPNIIYNPGSTFTTSGFGNITFNSKEVTVGPYGGPTVVEFKAPSAGTLSGTFATVQVGNIAPNAYLVTNVDTLSQLIGGALSLSSGPQNFSFGVSAGEKVDLVVWGSNANNKTTQLDATFIPNPIINGGSPVPEPSTFVLMGLGGISLAIGAYRRRRIASV